MLPIIYGPESRFETRFGRCVISWTDTGLVDLKLPRDWACRPPPSGPRTDPTKLLRPDPGVPAFVADAIHRVRSHLCGKVPAYDDLPLDLHPFSDFAREVLQVVRGIPVGETRSYRDVAHAIGRPSAARAVARALAANRLPLIIPCHRVVSSNGAPGGYSGPGGVATKTWLLEIEKSDRESR